MSRKNRQGLSRTISEAVKREVRQRCGFGCVICGSFMCVEYDHYNPEWSDATKHDPNGITLLCGSCHAKKTRHFTLDNRTIALWDKSPFCKQRGYSDDPADGWIYKGEKPTVFIGSNKFVDTRIILRIEGDDVLSINVPDQPGAAYLLNVFLCDSKGKYILKIIDNEWKIPSDNWDVEQVGSRIYIRKALGEIILIISAKAGGQFIIEKIDMLHKGTRFLVDNNSMSINGKLGGGFGGIGSTFINAGIEIAEGKLYVPARNLLKNKNVRKIPFTRQQKKTGRNEECPCGSKQKYKRCCGQLNKKEGQ